VRRPFTPKQLMPLALRRMPARALTTPRASL
jgi:hypothetical protein